MIPVSSRSKRLGLVVVAVALLAVALVGSISMLSDPVAAQPTTNSTTVVAQVDQDVRVTNYSYDSEESIMTIQLQNTGGSSTTATLTEAIDPGSGSSSFGIEQARLAGGSVIDVEVEMLGSGAGAGVMITTPESIEQGTGAFISADTGPSIVSGPSTWRDVQVGGAVGIGATMLMTLLVSWHVVARKSADYEEVDIS